MWEGADESVYILRPPEKKYTWDVGILSKAVCKAHSGSNSFYTSIGCINMQSYQSVVAVKEVQRADFRPPPVF